MKIGLSGEPSERVKALASDSGLDLDLLYQTPRMKLAAQVEEFAHRILRPYRKEQSYAMVCNTEWFNVPEAKAISAVQEAIRLVKAACRLREIGVTLGQWSWK